MSTVNSKSQNEKFFLVKIYVMYDGKEFPTVDLIAESDIEAAAFEAESRCGDGHYSFDSIQEKDESGYWSDCGAHLVRVKSITEITESTYKEMLSLI